MTEKVHGFIMVKELPIFTKFTVNKKIKNLEWFGEEWVEHMVTMVQWSHNSEEIYLLEPLGLHSELCYILIDFHSQWEIIARNDQNLWRDLDFFLLYLWN